VAQGIGYTRNQRVALRRFLDDGRLPMHNNVSELNLRREVVGRKNWLFVGSHAGGEVNATFASLLASCSLHKLEPFTYVRDLLCLLPRWPSHRVLELAPAYWRETTEKREAQEALDANVLRRVVLGLPSGPRIAHQKYPARPLLSATGRTECLRRSHGEILVLELVETEREQANHDEMCGEAPKTPPSPRLSPRRRCREMRERGRPWNATVLAAPAAAAQQCGQRYWRGATPPAG
jgi:hypothetical protein